jgi:hypothetical protein
MTLRSILQGEPGLNVVWNWQAGAPRARAPGAVRIDLTS